MALSVNDLVSTTGQEQPARVSFVAVGKSRELYAICPKPLATAIGNSGLFLHNGFEQQAGGSLEPQSSYPRHAVHLIGAFKLDYGQEIEERHTPLSVASSAEVLGSELRVFGVDSSPKFKLVRTNVVLEISQKNIGSMIGFLELEAPDQSLEENFTNGALLVDSDGRGTAILVGQSDTHFFAVPLRECLNFLQLEPIGSREVIIEVPGYDFEEEDPNREVLADYGKIYDQPACGQLATIFDRLDGGLVDA